MYWCFGVLVALGVLTVGFVKVRHGSGVGRFRGGPASTEPSVERSAADAKLLSTRLGLQAGVPTVIEFMDFECPPCRQSWPRLKAILQHQPRLRYRAVNFPLSMHPDAFGAAVAEEIAAKFGKRPKVFDDLFTGKTELDIPNLNKYLALQELPGIVGTDKAAPFSSLVEQDMKLGSEMKVQGTPTTFVLSSNGSLHEVRDLTLVDRFAK